MVVRLRTLVESRIHGDMYVRFGGEFRETSRSNTKRRSVLILRINAATTQVKSYFSAGTSLMYAIGAIVGLIGAVKVYNKWSHGEPDTGKVAAAWFGSCVFLVIVATVLQSFFGV